jgi:hypothetical protein
LRLLKIFGSIYAHFDEQQIQIKNTLQAASKKDYDVNDLIAGREYVEAYVHFIHYVEAQFGGNKVENSHDEHKH